jgi:hypothetical protein
MSGLLFILIKLKNKIEAAVDIGTDDCVVDSNAFLKETIDGI